MRAVVSVSLPEKMASELNKAANATGRAKSEIIKEALRLYLWEERFAKIRKKLGAKAKKIGVITDEDIFKMIS
ncbi:MAG: ribbon-helix-helix protein, CopG family [Nitrospira sp.]|nr:ribbon-helix-helix protein, CopG family [Nitrospira sp.]